jgi:MFS family permease
MRRRPSPLLGIFLTVFIDLLSFGLVIPDIQLRGDILGAHGVVRGLLIASFSIAQLLTAPFLGRLSDRVGRRPVLLCTTLLSTLSYLLYAHANVLWIMFASRIFAGVAGANIGVAFAYIADVTKPEERAKGMGMVGAAFGLGFVLGPTLGALLVLLGPSAGGHQVASSAVYGSGGVHSPAVLGYTAASLALLNFLYVWRILPESLRRGAVSQFGSVLQNLQIAIQTPALAILLALFFAGNFAFTNLESTYFLLTNKSFGLSQLQGAMMLGYVGIVNAAIQGGFIRVLTPRFGEINLVRAGFLMQIPALLLTPFAIPWAPQLVVLLALGIGAGIVQPSMSSLISRNAPPTIQGGIFGVTQAVGSLARAFGPLAGNALFDFRHWMPYALAATVMLIPAGLAWRLRMPQESKAPVPAH